MLALRRRRSAPPHAVYVTVGVSFCLFFAAPLSNPLIYALFLRREYKLCVSYEVSPNDFYKKI